MCAFFAVDLVTGQEMIKSISQMQTDVDLVLDQLNAVERKINLGDLDEARAVANFNQMVASDGAQSARTVLMQFRMSLNNAATAVQQGMSNYAEVESSIEHSQQQIRSERLAGMPHGSRHGGGMRAI